jgi:hypothetical protein
MDKQTPEPMEPAAHMYPSDLERFSRCETSAVAFSVAVVNPDERSVPLFTAEQVISLRASRDELLSATAAVAAFIGGAKDRLGRPDPAANDAMRAARDQVRALAERYGVQGGHQTYLDQCAALLNAAISAATGQPS